MPTPPPSNRTGRQAGDETPARRRKPPAAARLAGLSIARRSAGAYSEVDDHIYATIHEAVLDHRLPPGTKLGEVALAELFGVTRAAIRKALTRLAHTRLVDLRPHRGASVATPTVEESRDLFAARSAIEGAIVAALARGITTAQLRELRELTQAEHLAYAQGDAGAGLKLSIEFHRVLARMAGNAVLAEFLDQLVSRTPLVVLTHQGPVADTTCRIDEHAQVIDALAAGDEQRAQAAMRAHLDVLLAGLNLRRDDKPEADLAAILGVRRRA